MLDERKLKILDALISDYIFTADPVGSRTLSKRYLSNISSATIRNEMADLEELGYLEKPHTSSGRIPSDKAYRLYVDQLMKQQKLEEKEKDMVEDKIDSDVSNINELIFKISKLLSTATNYTTVVSAPQVTMSTIHDLYVVKINFKNIMIVLVFNTGIVKNLTMSLTREISDDYIKDLVIILNNLTRGMQPGEIQKNFEKCENIIKGIPKDDIKFILDTIISTIKSMSSMDFYLSGTTNIFNYPEFSELALAKTIMDALVEKDLLNEIFTKLNEEFSNIIIGKENEVEQFQKCSILTAPYSIGENTVGTISIIGPTRMEYSKALAWLDFTSHYLTYIMNNIYR